jgi:tRNA pseudouridine38-40 synthase
LRYFFHIGYNGTLYNGWQKLPHNNSIQFIFETQISRIVKSEINVVGCGRTDSHVHASQYFFHADLDQSLVPELKFRLNKILPDDITVYDIIPVEAFAHARLNAIERRYDYYLHRNKDPFLGSFSALYQDYKLDLQKMKEAADLLPRYNDYRSFYRTASKPKTTICNVTKASLYTDAKGERLRFTICANRFLSGMVRIIVHKLLEVGKGKLSVEQFHNYLRLTEQPSNIRSAYPQGLYLSRVTYPFLSISPRTHFDQLVNSDETWTAL